MSSRLTQTGEEGSGASTGSEGNPKHDAASDEVSTGGTPHPQQQTTTTNNVSGSSNTSSTTSTPSGSAAASSTSRDGALNVEGLREGPPNRNDAAEMQRDPALRNPNDDDRVLFKLGKTFLGLTFQAALALMIYREQPQQGDSSSANPSSLSSILLTSVGATTLFGFAFTMSGMMLQKYHPNVANFCSYAGVFLGALGFFLMMDVFAGKGLDWLVWAVGGVVLLVFAYILRREMEYD